jgi:hypothetical protein
MRMFIGSDFGTQAFGRLVKIHPETKNITGEISHRSIVRPCTGNRFASAAFGIKNYY